MSGLASYLAALGQRPESGGHITLDPRRAIEHLARAQLPGPHHYLLKLVQAAVASGAERVDVRIGWLAIDIVFVPPQPLTLDQLFFHLLDTRSPLGHLATGVNAALYEVQSVAIEQAGRRHLYTREGCWEEVASPKEGVRLRLRRTRWDQSQEVALLSERCGWSPVPIWVNGKAACIESWGNERTRVQQYVPGMGLSAPAASRATLPPRIERRLAGSRIPCCMALALEPAEGSIIVFVQHGVILCSQSVDLGCPGLVAIVAADDLPTDLSGFAVLEGDDLAERIARVHGESSSMVERESKAL